MTAPIDLTNIYENLSQAPATKKKSPTCVGETEGDTVGDVLGWAVETAAVIGV